MDENGNSKKKGKSGLRLFFLFLGLRVKETRFVKKKEIGVKKHFFERVAFLIFLNDL